MPPAARPSIASRLPLLVWVLIVLVLVVAAVTAAALIGTTWAIVAACLVMLATTAAVLLVLRDELGEAEPGPARERGVRGLTVATAVTFAVLLAVVVGTAADDADETRATGTDAPDAVRTVRGFVTEAFVARRGETACGLLTPAEQERVAALAGDGRPCREAIDDAVAEAPAGGARRTTSGLDAAATRVEVTRGGARVTIGTGPSAAVFELEPATGAERLEFASSSSNGWRIASGAAAALAR